MTDLVLKVGDQVFTRWKEVSVTTGIEEFAGGFELTCADAWALRGLALPVLPGLRCSVSIGGQPVITGFIDETGVRYNAEEHSLSFRGRDAAGDLVDSAAEIAGQGWQGRTLAQVAKDLCAPFGINVKVETDVGAPFSFAHLQPGETVFEALSRASRLRGCLLISDGLGNLVITRAGTSRAQRVLRLGVNILAGDCTLSHAERFNVYQVLAQSRESDTNRGAVAQQVLAREIDPEIRQGRVTIIDPFDPADQADAERLAKWTRTNRRARGERADLTVRGWLDGSRPWQKNTLVQVEDPWLRLSGDYLIVNVAFRLDDREGELADITVCPPAVYDIFQEAELDPQAVES